MLKVISSDSEILSALRAGRAIIDVRAPIEFDQGSVPSAVNLPLLNDDERALVGTCYKVEGPEAALKLGHRLISGAVRENRLKAWTSFLEKHPEAIVMCYRGGQRSQLTQEALRDLGFDLPRMDGGFKRVRQLLSRELESACENRKFKILSGYTGAGKTEALKKIRPSTALANAPFVLDLEELAHHRGSSFGNRPEAQPKPVAFENRLGLKTLEWSQNSRATVWIEDESRSIGRLVLPKKFFEKMSASPIWILERARSERAQRLTFEYLSDNYGFSDGEGPDDRLCEKLHLDIRRALINIERRLGGLETKKMLSAVDAACAKFAASGAFSEHWLWVEELLEKYYDPLYEHHLSKQEHRWLGRGPVDEFLAVSCD